MINLDQRPEKFESCAVQLALYNIVPYRFSACNGWENSIETINDMGVKYQLGMKPMMAHYFEVDNDKFIYRPDAMMDIVGRNYYCEGMCAGTIGIIQSHVSVLKDAYDSGYETIWVMEDDVEVVQNPHNVSYYIELLDAQVGKGKWDILFTDPDTKGHDGKYVGCYNYAERPNFSPRKPERFAKRKHISNEFKRIGARYGAYSMIVRRSGMKKILDFYAKYDAYLPFDMEYTLPNKIKLYSMNFEVVSTHPNAITDNSSPYYLDKINN